MKRVGFVGLGMMGEAMAHRLLEAGFSLRVFNRTKSKAREFSRQARERSESHEQVEIMDKPGEVAETGETVVTMLADDIALRMAVMGAGGLTSGPSRITHISMSTVSPETVRELASVHSERGDLFVSAPVFGRPEAAAARKLWIVCSGEQKAKATARPILEALGQGIFDYGDDPGAASTVKLIGNFMIASAVEAMAEGLALAEKNGIDRGKVIEMFGATLFACPIYMNYGRQIASEAYDKVGFSLPLGLKDMQLVSSAALASRVPMPFTSIVRDRLVGALAKGRDNLDWTALALGAREDAGLSPVPAQKPPDFRLR